MYRDERMALHSVSVTKWRTGGGKGVRKRECKGRRRPLFTRSSIVNKVVVAIYIGEGETEIKTKSLI